MRNRSAKLAPLFLVSTLALGLLTLVWALGQGSSQAQDDMMQNCPQPMKWAVSVWGGHDGADAAQAFATCGEGAVAAAYAIDPDTQIWSHWYAGRPQISNLETLDNMQGVIALGGAGAAASAIKANFEARPKDWIGHMSFLKELGINTIIIHFAYMRDSSGEYELAYPNSPAGAPSEEYLRELIATAKAEGFAVMLGPMVGRIGDPSPVEQIDDWNRFKADSIEIVVRWAAIAEELQVEYFMPFCELNFVLFEQEDPQRPGEARYAFEEAMALLAEWDSEALPQIRAEFSGRLISQIYSTHPGSLMQYPAAGYDIVGVAYHPAPDLAGVTTEFQAVLEDAQALAEQEAVEWMVVEMFFVPEGLGTDTEALETQAQLWRMATEEYLKATTVPPVGFGTFASTVGPPAGSWTLEGTPSEEVLRQFFVALDQQ